MKSNQKTKRNVRKSNRPIIKIEKRSRMEKALSKKEINENAKRHSTQKESQKTDDGFEALPQSEFAQQIQYMKSNANFDDKPFDNSSAEEEEIDPNRKTGIEGESDDYEELHDIPDVKSTTLSEENKPSKVAEDKLLQEAWKTEMSKDFGVLAKKCDGLVGEVKEIKRLLKRVVGGSRTKRDSSPPLTSDEEYESLTLIPVLPLTKKKQVRKMEDNILANEEYKKQIVSLVVMRSVCLCSVKCPECFIS